MKYRQIATELTELKEVRINSYQSSRISTRSGVKTVLKYQAKLFQFKVKTYHFNRIDVSANPENDV